MKKLPTPRPVVRVVFSDLPDITAAELFALLPPTSRQTPYHLRTRNRWILEAIHEKAKREGKAPKR